MTSKSSHLSKFIKAARDLEADDSKNRFNERLGKVAKANLPAPVKKSKTLPPKL